MAHVIIMFRTAALEYVDFAMFTLVLKFLIPLLVGGMVFMWVVSLIMISLITYVIHIIVLGQ